MLFRSHKIGFFVIANSGLMGLVLFVVLMASYTLGQVSGAGAGSHGAGVARQPRERQNIWLTGFDDLERCQK